MPTYSFGEDSPLKFEIPDKLAQRYNEAVDQFFKAQQRFNQKFGRRWNPANDAIEIKWSKKQRKAWNDFANIFDKAIEKFDQGQGAYHANDIMDDFLIKNTASAAAVGADRWGLVISLAVGSGALCGYLRGL